MSMLVESDFLTRLVLALAHFLWQGAAIGVSVWVARQTLQRYSARLRYSVFLFALATMPLCAAVTLLVLPEPQTEVVAERSAVHGLGTRAPRNDTSSRLSPPRGRDSAAHATRNSRDSKRDGSPILAPPESTGAVTRTDNAVTSDPIASVELGRVAPDDPRDFSNSTEWSEPPGKRSRSELASRPPTVSNPSLPSRGPGMSGDPTLQEDSSPARSPGQLEPAAGSPTASNRKRSATSQPAADGWDASITAALGWRENWQSVARWLAIVYVSGVLLMILRVSLGLRGGARLRACSRPVDEPELLALLRARSRELGLRVVPAFAWCGRVAVPTVVGLVRPVILLPTSLASGLTLDQLDVLVAHELAHIRRWDPLVNVLQRFVEALLFFHPAVWFVSRQIRIERELCADDLVIGLGADPVRYANSLVEVAERALGLTPDTLVAPTAVSATGDASELGRRVSRLLAEREHESLRLRHPISIVCVIALLTSFAAGAIALTRAGLDENAPNDRSTWKRVAVESVEGALLPVTADSTGRRNVPVGERRLAVLIADADRRVETATPEPATLEVTPKINVHGDATLELPNGVVVEVAGVCRAADPDAGWWRPDGDTISRPTGFPVEVNSGPDKDIDLTRPDPRRAVCVRVRNLPVGTPHELSANADWSNSVSGRDAFHQLALTVPLIAGDAAATGTVRLRLAGYDWQPIARFSATGQRLDEVASEPDVVIESIDEQRYGDQIPVTRVRGSFAQLEGESVPLRFVATGGSGRVPPVHWTRNVEAGRIVIECLFDLPRFDLTTIDAEVGTWDTNLTFREIALNERQQPDTTSPRSEGSAPTQPMPRDTLAATLASIAATRLPPPDSEQLLTAYREFHEVVRTYADPNLAADEQRAVIRSFDRRVTSLWGVSLSRSNPAARDFAYLAGPDRLRSLQWTLFMALRRRPTEESRARLEAQRDWMRQYIRMLKQPEDPARRKYHTHERHLKELEDLISDPLNILIHDPLSDEQFEELKQQALKYADKEAQLIWANIRLGQLLKTAHVGQHGERTPRPEMARFHGQASRLHDPFDPFGASKRFSGVGGESMSPLNDYRRDGSVLILDERDVRPTTIEPAVRSQGLAAVDAWLEDHERGGNLLFDHDQRRLIGVRGTRLLPLEATSWLEIDQIPTRLLTDQVRRHGSRFWSLPAPIDRSWHQSMLNAAAAVLTADDRLFVMKARQIQFNAVYWHLRPHEFTPRPGSPVTRSEARQILRGPTYGHVRERLARELAERIHNPKLEQRAEEFIEQLRRGDPRAAEWMSRKLHPRAARIMTWWDRLPYHEVREYPKLRKQIEAGELRVGNGGFRSLRLLPDHSFDVATTRLSAWFRVIGIDSAGQQWQKFFLLSKETGDWQIVGHCDARTYAEDFLRQAPSHDIAWGEATEVPGRGSPEHRYYDIDAQRWITPPETPATAEWLAEKGVDLFFDFQKLESGAMRMFVRPVDMSALDVAHDFGWQTPAAALPRIESADVATDELTGVRLFRTRDGAAGVLRVDHRGYSVDLRYKLLSPEAITSAKQSVSKTAKVLPTSTGWLVGARGIEYRVRQEKESWRPGETPLFFVDLRNPHRVPGVTVQTFNSQGLFLDGAAYGRYRSNNVWRPIPDAGFVTVPVVLNAELRTLGRRLQLQPGLHRARFRMRLFAAAETLDGDPVGKAERESIPPGLLTEPVSLLVEEADGSANVNVAKENLRRELTALEDGDYLTDNEVPGSIATAITPHLPDSGDWLLDLIATSNEHLRGRACPIFRAYFDRMSDAQMTRYLELNLVHEVRARPKYLAGSDATIDLRVGFLAGDRGLPHPIRLHPVQTTTTCLLDGKPYGEPVDRTGPLRTKDETNAFFRKPVPSVRVHRLPLTELTAGEHRLKLISTYRYEYGDRTFSGRFESPEQRFVVSDDQTDELLAPSDAELTDAVTESFQLAESSLNFQNPEKWGNDIYYTWHPHTVWNRKQEGENETWDGLHSAVWRTRKPLPVDLCFDVALEIEKTGEVLAGEQLFALHGEREYGCVLPADPQDPRLREAADEEGYVRVHAILTPSRSLAYSRAEVSRYFGQPIRSGVFRLRLSDESIYRVNAETVPPSDIAKPEFVPLVVEPAR